MSCWLLKTEPSCYRYADLEREGRTVWDGVTNALALKHLRTIVRGDEALVYHTGDERAAVGIARVVSDPYPDPQADDPRRVVVDLEPVRRLPVPVTLAELKADPALREFALLRNPRLSVVPVPPAFRTRLLALGGLA
ncbi:MAG TPA: EVE domain-containing protein [Thermoanaerobaculia bacterium]|nr:EVE domain-containing protein [Thermoanaerobaculia bacterium]